MLRPTRCSSSSSTRPATTCGGRIGPDYRFPRDWQAQRFRQRDIAFAWGPTADRQLRRTRVGRARDRLGQRRRQGQRLLRPPRAQAVAGRRPRPTSRASSTRVTVRWPAGASPSRYDLQFSDDGSTWRTVRHVERARGDVQHHLLPRCASARACACWPARSRPPIELGEAADANAFFARIARQSRRGAYPRAYVGEQSYWTVFGVDGGRVASLLSEDGVVEPVPGVGALEPFLVSDGRVASWADARISHSLRDGDLPMPATHWRVGDLGLDIAAFGAGNADDAQAVVRYTVRNLGKRARRLALALAWRPFQANPPTQFLAHRGGASPIETLKWDGGALWVNGALRLKPMQSPSSVRVEPAAAGPVGDWLARGAAGGPGAEHQRPRWLRQRRAALRHEPRSWRAPDHRRRPAGHGGAVARKHRRRPRAGPRRGALACRARQGRHRRPRRGGSTSPARCAPPSATSSSTAADRPCSRAHARMRDRGSGTGR